MAVLVGLARVISDGVSICYLQDVLVEPGLHRTGSGRALVTAVLEPYTAIRQKVLLTDAEPARRRFYEALGFQETHDVHGGSLRAFIRFNSGQQPRRAVSNGHPSPRVSGRRPTRRTSAGGHDAKTARPAINPSGHSGHGPL